MGTHRGSINRWCGDASGVGVRPATRNLLYLRVSDSQFGAKLTETMGKSSHWLACAVRQEEIPCVTFGAQGNLPRKKH